MRIGMAVVLAGLAGAAHAQNFGDGFDELRRESNELDRVAGMAEKGHTDWVSGSTYATLPPEQQARRDLIAKISKQGRSAVQALVALEGNWPKDDGATVAGLLYDAESGLALMDPDARRDPFVQKYAAKLPLAQRRAKAAVARDRAVIAMVRAKNASAGDDYSAEAAKEYFTLALEAWDEALAALPDFKSEVVQIEDYKNASKSVGDWRAVAAKRLAEL